MKKIVLLSSFVALCNTLALKAQSDTSSTNKSIQYRISYIADQVNNLRGGKLKASAYLGMATVKLLFDTQKAALWKGTQFFVNAVNTHGATPSADFLGDKQIASNIEAGNHSYIQELWLKHSMGSFEFTLGLQDLNIEFANADYAALFINSSFGMLPTISANTPAPIFPLTNLGFTGKCLLTENATWLFALYNGQAIGFDDNPYNLRWTFSSTNGLFAITEFQYRITLNKRPGVYKLGFFNRSYTMDVSSESFESPHQNTTGIYIYANQELWQQTDRSIGLFAQWGYSPSENSISQSYLGLGVNLTGFLSQSKTDVIGLAVAHSNHKSTHYCNESIIELTWQKQLGDHFFIQPDLQYIINSASESPQLDNCLVAILRIAFSF